MGHNTPLIHYIYTTICSYVYMYICMYVHIWGNRGRNGASPARLRNGTVTLMRATLYTHLYIVERRTRTRAQRATARATGTRTHTRARTPTHSAHGPGPHKHTPTRAHTSLYILLAHARRKNFVCSLVWPSVCAAGASRFL